MKLYAFLIGTICSCLSVFGLSNTTIAQTNEQATAPAEQKKTIQVPVYTKDDVMLNNGLFLKKSYLYPPSPLFNKFKFCELIISQIH